MVIRIISEVIIRNPVLWLVEKFRLWCHNHPGSDYGISWLRLVSHASSVIEASKHVEQSLNEIIFSDKGIPLIPEDLRRLVFCKMTTEALGANTFARNGIQGINNVGLRSIVSQIERPKVIPLQTVTTINLQAKLPLQLSKIKQRYQMNFVFILLFDFLRKLPCNLVCNRCIKLSWTGIHSLIKLSEHL